LYETRKITLKIIPLKFCPLKAQRQYLDGMRGAEIVFQEFCIPFIK
jgi:hypothetical protein